MQSSFPASSPKRIFLIGGTGTIGRATVRALVADGHAVTCFVRRRGGGAGSLRGVDAETPLEGATVRFGDVCDPVSVEHDGFAGDAYDVLVSCIASRTGVPADSRAIDYGANSIVLKAAERAGVRQMILLSAICVQKPLLEFQKAKLAFEAELIASGLTYSIVRPTAFFKSLSGQVERVRRGKPFLIFGDGRLTACKPISDEDLAAFLVRCITDPSLQNRILPIGGPGPAITPRQQGEALFALLGREPRFKSVPVSVLRRISTALGMIGRVSPAMARKAELARIGHYYATQSMLVLDPKTGAYDAAATPSFGTQTLFDFYESVVNGTASIERGDHSVF